MPYDSDLYVHYARTLGGRRGDEQHFVITTETSHECACFPVGLELSVSFVVSEREVISAATQRGSRGSQVHRTQVRFFEACVGCPRGPNISLAAAFISTAVWHHTARVRTGHHPDTWFSTGTAYDPPMWSDVRRGATQGVLQGWVLSLCWVFGSMCFSSSFPSSFHAVLWPCAVLCVSDVSRRGPLEDRPHNFRCHGRRISGVRFHCLCYIMLETFNVLAVDAKFRGKVFASQWHRRTRWDPPSVRRH